MSSWLMNMWVGKGGQAITAKRLLGPGFFEEEEMKPVNTKEEWEKTKKSIETMARFHSKVLRQLRGGQRGGVPVKNAEVLNLDSQGALKGHGTDR